MPSSRGSLLAPLVTFIGTNVGSATICSSERSAVPMSSPGSLIFLISRMSGSSVNCSTTCPPSTICTCCAGCSLGSGLSASKYKTASFLAFLSGRLGRMPAVLEHRKQVIGLGQQLQSCHLVGQLPGVFAAQRQTFLVPG